MPKTSFIVIRASEMLDQGELIGVLERRFPEAVRRVGPKMPKGMETVEVRVSSDDPMLAEVGELIRRRRQEAVPAFTDFTIGRYARRYTAAELRDAEILRLIINSHFEPAGQECGTIYETVCPYCNLGTQMSDLILDLRHVPQHKDISETIASTEWIVSSRFVEETEKHSLSGAEFLPVFDLRNPTKRSEEWHQLKITGQAGWIAEPTLLGGDPFSSEEIRWECPLRHSMVAQVLSELYLRRDAWDGSDFTITSSLFGQGQNLLRPTPLMIISQRTYRMLQAAGLKGYSVEVVHLL